MMAHRASGRRRLKRWSSIVGSADDATAAGTTVGGTLAFTEPATVLRLLGEYIFFPTAAPVAGDRITMTVGIGVVSTDAAVGAVASLPDPAAEPEFPWLFWAEHALGFNSTSVVDAQAGLSLRRSFDVGSMRKIKPRESLVCLIEYVDIVGTPPITVVIGGTRVLLAVH